MRGSALGVVLLLATMPGLAAAHVAPPRERWPSVRYAPLLVRADSLRGARLHGYLDSLLARARADGNRDLEMVVSVRDASVRGFFEGAQDSAVAVSQRWLGHARATHDTLTWCMALRTIGYADIARQRFATSQVTYREMLPLAVRARLAGPEGYARIGLSFIAIQQGRFADAERGYTIALRKLEGRDPFGARTARAGLAHALLRQVRIDAARRQYERVAAEARAAGDVRNEADALNDLASIEYEYGDPARAEPMFRAAARAQRAIGQVLRAMQVSRNAALCFAVQGRLDEQAALLDSLVRVAEGMGVPDFTARCLTDLASIRRRQERFREAREYLRRAPLARRTISTDTWMELVTERIRLETVDGEPGIALAIATQSLDSLNVSGDDWLRAQLLQAQGLAAVAAGDPAASVTPLRESLQLLDRVGGLAGSSAIICGSSLGDAFWRMGKKDSALAQYRRAADRWERMRATPSDPVWRQAYDRTPGELFVPITLALLDPWRGGTAESRAVEAFDMVQRFRSRTLEDALRGAEGRSELPRASVADLRRALRPGEVLLDIVAGGPDTTCLLVVGHGAIQAAGTVGLSSLLPRLRRFRDLVANRSSDDSTIAAAATELGAQLLGPVAASLRGAATILVSAGSLDAYPLGMLRLPGEGAPIAARHGFAVVPSATLLADSRGVHATTPRRDGLTVLSRTTDAGGARLEGVVRESRWLARRFPTGRVMTNDGTRTLETMLAAVGTGDVLHVSSHARAPATAPWTAGFLLGRGSGPDAYLTASRICRLKRPARVCVLASCETAGAANPGEGLPDLASAFLEAGTSTVIATLWKVDDQATTAFVQDLYESLARGATTGEALRAAQHAAIASRDRNAARDWGGFVLYGDPGTRVNLGAARR